MTKPIEKGNFRGEDPCRAILSALPYHIAVLDQAGIITEVNEPWLRFGRQNGIRDIASISAGVNYLEVCRRATVDNIPEAKSVQQGIESILDGTKQTFEMQYSCPCEEKVIWYCVIVTPLAAGNGAVVCHDNITRRVEQEHRFQKSEEYYRAIIENILDIVYIINRDGVILYVNPAVQGVLGHATDRLTGVRICDLVHQRDVPQMRRMMRQLQERSATPRTAEIRVRHSNGSWRYLEIIGKSLPDHAADAEIILTSRDITARRAAELALKAQEAALQNNHAQMRALTGRVLVADDEARRRVSRDLHDDLNQRLAIIALDLGKVFRCAAGHLSAETQNDLRALQNEITKLSDEVRSAAHFLHPSILDDLGLVVALRSLCADFSRRHSMQVRFMHHQVPEMLATGARASLYRIVQECLWNVVMHARSDTAVVTIRGTDAGLRVIVRDFGVGFDPASTIGKGGLGLISIEERARLLGGNMRIRSRPGRGCRVVIEIPIEKGGYETPARTVGR